MYGIFFYFNQCKCFSYRIGLVCLGKMGDDWLCYVFIFGCRCCMIVFRWEMFFDYFIGVYRIGCI